MNFIDLPCLGRVARVALVARVARGGNVCQAHGPGPNGVTAKAGGRLSGGISLRPGGGLRHGEAVGRCWKLLWVWRTNKNHGFLIGFPTQMTNFAWILYKNPLNFWKMMVNDSWSKNQENRCRLTMFDLASKKVWFELTTCEHQ